MRLRSWFGVFVGILLCLGADATENGGKKALSLSATRLKAQGRQEALLEVGHPGRYALSVKSPQGARLQIVDRMTGPSESDGHPGERDGRLNLFLDAGHYKLQVSSPEKGQGELSLEAKAFHEMQADRPQLLDQVPLESRLEDFQSRNWRIQIPRRQLVFLEAQGRSLGDLRLWHPEGWMLEAQPSSQIAESLKGCPERRLQILVTLDPGTYHLVAYGAPALPWAEESKESKEHALYLRSGIPSLPEAAQISSHISPFGLDRFLVPRPADSFLLRLPEKAEVKLEVAPFKREQSEPPSPRVQTLDKRSADPEARIQLSGDWDYAIVSIHGLPGQAYRFQCFQQRDAFSYQVHNNGNYRFSSLHSGNPDEQIDATGLLVSEGRVVTSDVLPLGKEKIWSRRFNLLGVNTVFFQVEETGDFQILAQGTPAEFRFEPFYTSRPSGYSPPAFKEAGSTTNLDRGYWVLTIKPKTKGILQVVVLQKGWLERLKDWVTGQPLPEVKAPKAACLLPSVGMETKKNYQLWLNQQLDSWRGVDFRPLPLQLDRALAVTPQPGTPIQVEILVEEPRVLRMLPGTGCTLQVDRQPWKPEQILTKGCHQLSLQASSSQIQSLQTLPPPAPPQPPVQRPLLTPGAPLFLDLAHQAQATFRFEVPESGLYRLESTGLLKTALSFRSAVRPMILSAEANGVGRNALVDGYLRAGSYLATVRTLDQSAGRLGLVLTRSKLREGGRLEAERDHRAELPAGEGLRYRFQIQEKGNFRLRSLGSRALFPFRLEDREGWPLLPSGGEADLTRLFEPGEYQVLSLPSNVPSLRNTRLERLPEPRKLQGKGPHPIGLHENLSHRWREPNSGEARQRDIYTLKLPAEMDVKFTLDNEQMQGFLFRDMSGESPKLLPPGKGWSGRLPRGNYRLEVECSRLNDQVDYQLSVSTEQLAPGLSRSVSVPGQLELVVPESGTVELASAGQGDNRAFLYPVKGGLPIAFNDDAPEDWNFRITQPLAAGRYLLKIEPVGEGSEKATTVSMHLRPEIRGEALSLDSDQSFDLKDGYLILPIQPTKANLVALRLSAPVTLGCSIEALEKGSVLAHFLGKEIRMELPPQAVQLRIWSLDGPTRCRIQSQSCHLPLLNSAEFAQGKALPAQEVLGRTMHLARLRLDRPGSFRLEPKELRYSSGMSPLEAVSSGTTGLKAGEILLALDGPASNIHLSPLKLERELSLQVPAGARQTLDLAKDGWHWVQATGGAGLCPSGELFPASHAFFRDLNCWSLVRPGQALHLWDPRAEAEGPLNLELQAFPFSPPTEKGELHLRTLEESLPGGALWSWKLPPGFKEVDLALEEPLAAVLLSQNRIEELGVAPTQLSLNTQADTLLVLNPSTQPHPFRLSLRTGSASRQPSVLKPGQILEILPSRAGSLRFQVETSTPQILNILGAQKAEWWDAKGLRHEGFQHRLDQPGLLHLEHGTAPLKVWLAAPEREIQDRWGGPEPLNPKPLTVYQLSALVEGPQAFSFELSKASLVRFRTEAPAVLGLWKAGEDQAFRIQEGAPLLLDLPLPEGSYRLALRPFGDVPLRGHLEFSPSELIPLKANEGPRTLIQAGESRCFRFQWARKERLGLGISASRDCLQADLMDETGKQLGSGTQQFLDLSPGIYLLRVSLPPGETPLSFTPYLFGLEPTGTRPPDDVLQEFLRQLGVDEK